MLHSRILPRVLGKLSDGGHVGPERMDCAEWQKIVDKASEWQTLREEDATKVSWEEVYHDLDLASTYEHVLTHCAKSHGGDPTGPAGRSVRFPTGVGFMSMGIESWRLDVTSKPLVLPRSTNPHLASQPRSRTTPSSLIITNLCQIQLALIFPTLARKMGRLTARNRGCLTQEGRGSPSQSANVWPSQSASICHIGFAVR